MDEQTTNWFEGMFGPAIPRHGHDGYYMTTDHAASSYGQPVLVGPDGTAYGAGDLLPCGCTGDWARRRITPRPYILTFETVTGLDRERRMISPDDAAALDEPALVGCESAPDPDPIEPDEYGYVR